MGSFITSSIGTMRVTEQIDALEVMGVNSLNYLVFKNYSLVAISVCNGISMFFRDFRAGWQVSMEFTSVLNLSKVLDGFIPFHIFYALKTLIFAMLLAYHYFHGLL
jgi:phospholipid/cholesterol/gamma-HCH transport system permease protein